MSFREKNQFPTVWQAILLLAFLFSVMIVTMIAAQWAGISPKTIAVHPFIYAVINILSFGFILRFGLKLTMAPLEDVFLLRRPDSFIPFLATLLTILGLQILFSEVDNIFRNLGPLFRNNSMADLFSEAANPLEVIFLIVIAAPIYEELLFRGLFVFGFEKNYGVRHAIWISAVLFGLMHIDPTVIDPLHIIYTTGLGIFLALVFVKTRSLWPNIIGHAFNNGLPFLIGFLPYRIPGFNTVEQGKALTQPIWFDVLGFLLVISGLFLLLRKPSQIRD